MNIPEFSVKRPIFISMISCIVLILGGVALSYLPVDLMPDITYPGVTIITTYEDASPEEVEELISKRIERSLSAVSGVKEITSTSGEGSSNVTVSFNWGTNLESAVADVRDRLDRVVPSLPDDADRPILYKFDSASSPILRIGVATNIDLMDARQLVEDQIQYRLERINGVASAEINGGLVREIQVLFDVDKARKLDTSLENVLSKLKEANVTTPAGNLREDRLEIRVRTPGIFTDIDQIRNTVIATGKNGELIKVGDVAEVVDTHEKLTRYVRVNGKPGIMMQVYKQSGSNTVQVANGVLKEMERVNEEFGSQVQLQAIINTADFIERAISGVADSAFSGGLLAVVVLLFFLRNIGSTIVISISIPMSIIATFALVYFCGYTLNLMTLGGLALGVGMLVDNSIVVLENITRLRDEGMHPHEAAVKGTSEVVAALTASTLTTLAVFLPLLFMEGMAGVMFKQFSAVVSFSLGCSLFTAITLVPMMASRLLRPVVPPAGKPSLWHRIMEIPEYFLRWLVGCYSDALDAVIRFRWLFIGISVALVGASLLLIPLIGTELMPKADEGEVRVFLEMEVGTSPEAVNDVVIMTENIIREVCGKDMRGWVTFAGSSSWRSSGGHKANYNIRLVPRTQRRRSDQQITAELDRRLKVIPGAVCRVRAGQGIFSRMMGAGSGEGVAVELRGFDFDTAAALAARVSDAMASVPGITDVKLSRDLGVPEDRLVIDRDKANDLGVPVKEIADALRTILAGSEAGEFRENGDEYTILVKVKDADLLGLDQILDLSMRNDKGELVVLRNLINYERVKGPVNIERKNQERVLTVGGNIQDRDLGSVVQDIQAKLEDIPMPPGFTLLFSGDYEDQQESFRELMFAFSLALALVYMVMACQFESLRDPLVVMFSVPLAAIGVVLALFLTRTTFNLQSFIGVIMLAGIVVNNAILLVDTANLLRNEEGMPLEKAVREAGKRRLRPILMTTLTTVLGLFPLALGRGDGGETQAPMARAVIGGLTSSTVITLFFVPAVYLVAETLCSKKKTQTGEERS